MRIAIPYDYEKPVDIRREGIGVYVSLLVKALLDNIPDLEIEFWTYSYNRKNVILLFQDSFEKYPDRISVFDDACLRNNLLKKCIYVGNYAINKVCYKILYLLKCLFISDKKIRKLIKQQLKAFVLNLREKQLKKVIKKESRADVVYCFFVIFKMGLWFQCPKFVQVHDLFTFALKKKFEPYMLSLGSYNGMTANILGQYALDGAVFISSSDYIVREHCLPFIPNILPHQTAVIPFPPLIKDFGVKDILDEKSFKKKYKICGKYIALPSQNRPNKNWGVIFRALARLKKLGINLNFVTTGHVSDVKSDEKLVNDLGVSNLIIETGSLSSQELYALYKYADLVVVPTIIEGLGMSGQALEAMKVGTPVVHSKSLGIEESLHSAGLTMEKAHLNWFDLDDDEMLATKIQDVLKNPKIHATRQKVVLDAYLKFSWKDVAENYMRIFKKIKEC